MNNIVRTITWNKKFTHVSHLYQNLNFLKKCYLQIGACQIHA